MRALPTLLVTAALVATACSTDGSVAAPSSTARPAGSDPATSSVGTDPDTSGGSGGGRLVRALTPFADCRALLEHVQAAARDRVGPWGLEDGSPFHVLEGEVAIDEMAADDAADAGAPAPAEEPAAGRESDVGFTGTNVQELGVDEPDIVKTDGDRILAVSENVLSYIDLSAAEPVVSDRLAIPEGWGHELFFRGDRALLFTNGGEWAQPVPFEIDEATDAEAEFADDAIDAIVPPEHWGPAALIVEIDLSDPSDLTITASMRIEGQYLSARAIGEHVRLAVSSGPNRLPWVYPQSPSGEERATETNREIIDESTLDDWVPSFELHVGDDTDAGPLLGCGRTHYPADFAGFDVISVIDLDLAEGLAGGFDANDAVGVLAGGQTIYSSNDRFYVATTKWAGADLAIDEARFREWSEDFETDLHAFAISPGEPTEYVASGTIRGSLLNQFSLDEHDGYLRAIATDGSPWDRRNLSETRLTVMEEQDDRLIAVGEVGGLGKGERLFSARLLDDVGFAVTFRQIDPFYVLDLRDPRNPEVTGELKIPGVSTYLHPVGDDRVLGIGQDATETGAVLGLKLSLFDVSDPADPREVSVWKMPDANSPVEWDHRAFQMWGDLAIVPVQSWMGGFNGAIVFDVRDEIVEVGRVTHLDAGGQPSSDCRPLEPDQLTDDTELYWMALEGEAHLQVCEADDVGGWGDHYCERIPADELQIWFGDHERAREQLAAIGLPDDGRIELCWPDGGYHEAIQRSLVVDDLVWTMTPSTIQANRLDDLSPVVQLRLR